MDIPQARARTRGLDEHDARPAREVKTHTAFLRALFILLLTVSAHAQSPTPAPSPTPTPSATPSPTPNPAASPAPNGDNAAAPAPSPRRATWVAYILRRHKADQRIRGLEFPEGKVPVVLVPKGPDLRPTVVIRGIFNRPGWTLTGQGMPIMVGAEKHDFAVSAHLLSRINEINLQANGPKGEVESERVFIFAPQAQEFHVVSSWDRLMFSLGTGFTNYAQTGYGDFQAITGVVGLHYNTDDETARFGLLGNVDMTAITFASSPITTGPQILEAKLDGTLMLNRLPEYALWKTQLIAGLSYLTMFSNGSPFGFSDLLAPEIGLRTKYISGARTNWIGEFRLVPLGDIGNFSELGYDIGIAWSRMLPNSKRVEAGAVLSGYAYEPAPNTWVRTNLVLLKVGYSL